MTDISTASRIKISDDVLFQELQGEAVLLDLKTGVYFGLDHTGTKMWQLLEQHKTIPAVVAEIRNEFDVTEERCSADLIDLVTRLQHEGLVSVEAA